MAEDDKKPEKKRSPLYDAPRGQPKSGARAEKPEKKPDPEPKAEPAKDEGGDKQPKNDNGTAKAVEPKENAKPADKPEESAKPPMHEALNGIHKRHETERRDHHGNMREQFRQMATRHEKELKDFHAQHLAELAAGNAPAPGVVPGNAPEKKEAQAVAAAAPVE